MIKRERDTLIKWPSREALQKTMPFCFQLHYSLKVVAIIDCFELFIEKPSNLLAKSCTWSQYKHYNKAKYLISITPQGVISFVSKGWDGWVSDRHITAGEQLFPYRISYQADCLGVVRVTLQVPIFHEGKDKLTAFEVEETRNITNVLIHVERVIGCVGQRVIILSATNVLATKGIMS